MSSVIEEKGGFATYLLDAFRSSVANRTVGAELNDGARVGWALVAHAVHTVGILPSFFYFQPTCTIF